MSFTGVENVLIVLLSGMQLRVRKERVPALSMVRVVAV